MLANRIAPTLALLSILVSGCTDGFGSSSWNITEKESGFDGKTVTVARGFHEEENPTFVDVAISCTAQGKLSVSLTSYDSQLNGDQYEGDDFVVDGDGDLVGRIAFTDLEGQRQAQELWQMFSVGDYTNVAEWDVSYDAAEAMYMVAPDRFYEWAASVIPNAQGSQQEVAKRLREHVEGDYTQQLRFELLADLQSAMLMMQGGEVAEQAVAALRTERLTAEMYGYASNQKVFSPLASGRLFRQMLPVHIELSNGGGKREIVIPADNPAINEVLDGCGGAQWWSGT